MILSSFSVKYVPAWFPGAKFKREAAEWRKACRAMLEVPFAAVKKAIVSRSPCGLMRLQFEKLFKFEVRWHSLPFPDRLATQ